MTARNPTPKGLALRGGAIIGLCTAVCLLIASTISSLIVPAWMIAVSSVVIGLLSYFVISTLMERFIYRKIKLIYKSIHASKAGKDNMPLDNLSMNEDVITDVNEEVEKWASEKNAEISRLQDLSDYRREFLGNLFHEIKTPVFSVQGYLHTLKDGALHDGNVNQEYIEKAVKNIDRLDSIVEDLELIALQESNQLTIDWESYNLTALIKDVFDALELQSDEADTEFILKDGCDIPFQVIADKDKVRQVLVNLLTNAVKYGRPGGTITVGIYDMDDNILTEITDEGEGIAEEEIPRLFERFYRLDKSRQRTGKGGSGLGLAIVKHVIEAHDQRINVRSSIGKGSTFGFTLRKDK